MKHCQSCGVRLLQPHGFHGTGLCGPCMTGESATAQQVTFWCSGHPQCVACDESDSGVAEHHKQNPQEATPA